MDNHSSNSRSSSRYSKPVVFPRIKSDPRYNMKEPRNSHENLETDFSRTGSKIIKEHDDDFNRYILERLDFTERALEAERRERNVLEDHVRGLMTNLQRLGKDMTTLQHDLNSGERMSTQSNVLKNIDQVSGIGDLWNRLTLGDLNTIKLSGDLNRLSGEVSDLKRSQERSKQKLEKITKDIETLVTKVERSSLEFEKKFQQLKGDLDSKVTNFEQNRQIAENGNERVDENRYSKQEVEEHYSQVLKHFELHFDEVVEKHDLWQEDVLRKLSVLNEDLLKMKGATSINYEDLTRKIEDLRINQKKALFKSHETVKDKYRETFRVVYESITTMQTVLEAKLKMTEADLKTSINSILRTISQT